MCERLCDCVTQLSRYYTCAEFKMKYNLPDLYYTYTYYIILSKVKEYR